jgi:uncharacterized protein YkwD/D-arabinose 5-phosphate isomerase GutQ
MFRRTPAADLRTRQRTLRVEALERRDLLAFDPSPMEQELLLLVNHMRTDPQGEYDRLIKTTNPIQARDPAVDSALQFFNVDGNLLRSQWDSLTPVPPVAWNESLYNAAHTHNAAMIAAGTQSHQLPGEPDPGQRMINAGYNWDEYGENIFAFAETTLYAHAGFAIDWGGSTGGIQNPPGHRTNIMNAAHREAGLAIDVTSKSGFGPLVVTEDFASRSGIGNAFVVGAVWRDTNHSGWYNAGEGIGGETIEFTKAGSPTVTTTSLTAGGYQVQLAPGAWTARAFGPGGTVNFGNVVVGSSNAMVNFVVADNTPPTITNITDKSTPEDTPTSPIAFTIGDLESTAAQVMVSVTSSNAALVPDQNIVLGGSGSSRTLTITPAANQAGTTTITVTVTDPGGLTAKGTFVLTVTPVNDPPTLASVLDQTTAEDAPLDVPLAVGDPDTPLANLTLTATTNNLALLPAGSLTVTGTGSDRMLKIMPRANQSGSAVITVTVNDGSLIASQSFTLTVTPVNDPPTISPIRAYFALINDSAAATFFISDLETPAAQLTLTVESSNEPLLSQSGLSFSGTGTTRTLMMVPMADQAGTSVITIHVSDGEFQSSRSFTLTVSADPFPWHNVVRPADVNNDTHIVAGDALAVINYLNAFGAGAVPENAADGPPFYDVTGDNFVAADDALTIINLINAQGQGEGESAFAMAASGPAPNVQADVLAMLALDAAHESERRRGRLG